MTSTRASAASSRRRRKSVSVPALAAIATMTVVVLSGCFDLAMQEQAPPEVSANLTSSSVRAARRAYDGAPPVIPHAPQSAACTICHTTQGKIIPDMGYAPANPHEGSHRAGSLQNCLQCHVFIRGTTQFVDSNFQGLPQSLVAGNKAHPQAPPVIPHALAMRENCLACHSGPSARPEIRCSHPQRTNCRQCHVAVTAKTIATMSPVGIADAQSKHLRKSEIQRSALEEGKNLFD